MPKTVTRTVRDIVIADITNVSLVGDLNVPADLRVIATAELFDDTSGLLVDQLTFEVLPNIGTLTALSNIMKNDIVADANSALQARGDTDVEIPPV